MSDRTTAQQRRVWQNFLVLSETVRRETARDLQEVSGLSGTDFTVLATLASAEGSAMRSTEIARALDWETGRMSHHLRRMEVRGLIQRCRDAEVDGRAAIVKLTDEGLAAYRRSLGPHFRSIKHWFLDGLDPERVDQIDVILQALLDHVQHTNRTKGKEPS
ncbi:MarR family winged helix-turn-helix transcriptional regulator [Glycomyces sp. NPDC021274]|uniref:MarR family winged helix-turn-helix transcriptional regulator n=1 Tax=Glycomyces sp. NPDC021274 TaxID=3155120 RepID=UPI0033EFFADB